MNPATDSASRRKFLLAGLGGACLAGTRSAQAFVPESRMLDLQRNGQRLRVDISTGQGYRAAAWLLRDIQAGNVVGLPDPALLVWASRLQQAMNEHYRYTVFLVTSGLRTQQTNRITEGAAQHSLHLPDAGNRFHAVDLKPVGATLDQLESLAKQSSSGGVGRYENHLHLDARNSAVRW